MRRNGGDGTIPVFPEKRIVTWAITIIGNPLIAAALAGIMLLFF